jgi:DNA-binding transcriptional ArsR family regulator
MVNNNEQRLNDIFGALSDPTRRAILARLAQGQCMVSHLPNPHSISKAAISKHLKILERANLLERQKDGRVILCSTDLRSLDPALQLLGELGNFWNGRLDALEQHLKINKTKESRDE